MSVETLGADTPSMERSRASAKALDLAVIVPTFNEAGNVAAMVDALDKALDGLRWEAIFVDDNSTDGTPALVVEISQSHAAVRLLRRIGRRGLSTAVVEGMLATTAPLVAVIDADMQHDESKLRAMYDAVLSGEADIAVGTRYADGGSTGTWSEKRVRISKGATWVAEKLIGQTVSDPMSGFFLLKQEKLIEAVPKLSGVGFKILLDILLSSPKKLRIAEIPYEFRERHAGESKLDSAVALEFILLLLDKMLGGWIPPRLILFGAVGALGLVVHLLVLRLVLLADATFVIAQTAAVLIAIAFNYTLNNAITYRDRRRKGAVGWLVGLASFYVICGLGAVANVGVGTVMFRQDQLWWVAGAAGAVVGSVWNFALSSFLTWRKR